jgi:hypothetical protein
MRRPLVLIALLGSFSLIAHGDVPPALDGPDGLKAFDDLATYYANSARQPPYREALASLGEGGGSAQHAGQYLLGLFEQSMADETNGRAKSTRSPFWGGGSENAARTFRTTLAEKFGNSAGGDAAIPAALWLINEEMLPEGQAAGIQVLRRIKSQGATDAFARILGQPHPNQDVLVGAIDESGARGLSALQPEIVALENSYRSAVRAAARKAAGQLGAPAAPGFKPENAFTPALNALIQRIADRVLTPIPGGAQWMDIVDTNPDTRQGEKPARSHGWLVRTEADDYVILDWQGIEAAWPKKDTTLTPGTLAATARELEGIRKEGSREGMERLSLEGGLSAQFEPAFISVPEALVGAWSFARGDKATAAAVLFPCFDATKDDRWIDWATRDLLGNRYHQRMLDAFSLERDYGKALQIARHLSKPIFDGFNYQERARELAGQLARRMDDFKTFALPKPDEWERRKAGMKRGDQIAFLAAHLRLLNCMQMGQPGDVSYADPQYAETFSTIMDAARKAGSWPPSLATNVINPYNELKALALAPADIQLLLPYVTDDDFMPTYSYWRDFHPARTLHRVSWATADLVNKAAQETLVDPGSLENLDDAGKRATLDRIKAWCAAHEGKSASDLLAETIETTKDERDFVRAAGTAAQQKQPRLLMLAAARAEEFPDWRAAAKIAQFCFQSGFPGFVDQARKWIKETDKRAAADEAKPPKPANAPVYLGEEDPLIADYSQTRFWSALILLRDGDHGKMEGFDVLQPLLKMDDGSFYYPHCMGALLATKDEKVIGLACEVLKKPALLTTPWDSGDQLRRLFLAGRPECRDFLIATLKDDSPEGQSTMDKQIDGKTVTEPILKGRCIAEIVCQWRTDDYRIGEDLPNTEQIKKRAELAAWIGGQFDLVRKGRQPDMKTQLSPEVTFPL